MAYIESILINQSKLGNYEFIDNDEKSKIISNLSKINIFIGSNNSGKSKCMRSIFSDKELKFNSNSEKLNHYNELIKSFNKEINECFDGTISKVDDIGKVELKTLQYLEEDKCHHEQFLALINDIERLCEDSSPSFKGGFVPSKYMVDELVMKLKEIAKRYDTKIKKLDLIEFLDEREFKKIYIPTLRGLRPIDTSKDSFKIRTESDYFCGEEVDIFTGQNLYEEVMKLLCGDFTSRNHLREFEIFLGENFFDGANISLIPKIGQDVIYVKIGEEIEQPIYNLGDGIQSIIILTFKLFSEKLHNVLFFIEEPELYLHPGLQRKIIETFLKEEFLSYQFFITTHSNHLLDLTIDMKNISIYKFRKMIDKDDDSYMEKSANFTIENINSGDTSVLRLLGVNNSSVFLSNCTIWVEGITDRLYIRKCLKIYQEEKYKNKEIDKVFNEDVHYSFIEYSGGNITHWDFLDTEDSDESNDFKKMSHNSISNRIFLIADSDGYTSEGKSGTKKGKRIENLENFLGDRFYCLKAKEIENILPPEVIKKAIFEFRNVDKRILDGVQFNIDEYKDENLGEYIDKKISEGIIIQKEKGIEIEGNKQKKFKKDNTISSKVKFCENAIVHINKLEDLSEEYLDLCKNIYNFIKSSN